MSRRGRAASAAPHDIRARHPGLTNSQLHFVNDFWNVFDSFQIDIDEFFRFETETHPPGSVLWGTPLVSCIAASWRFDYSFDAGTHPDDLAAASVEVLVPDTTFEPVQPRKKQTYAEWHAGCVATLAEQEARRE